MNRERSKRRSKKRAGQGGAVPSLNCIEPNAAGIDCRSNGNFSLLSRRIGNLSPVRSFETFTQDLHRPEGSGYSSAGSPNRSPWNPRSVLDSTVFQILERGQASRYAWSTPSMSSHVPGRKSECDRLPVAAVFFHLGGSAACLLPPGGSSFVFIRSLLRHRGQLWVQKWRLRTCNICRRP